VVDYHANLAMDYLQSRRFPQAIAEFRTCIQHKPNELSLWHSFGAALAENGQFAEALDAFDRGLAIAPNSAALHSNRSATLRDLGRLDESYAAARRAIELDPNCPGAHNNLGALFYDDGRWEETLDAWRIACRTDPTAPGAHWNYARILLQLGHLEEGWEEFEWRLKVPSMFLNRKFPQPQWDGSDPTGKRILLHTEGGFGDALHFIRLVPELTARGGTWFLECQPELVRIFQNTPGLAGIIPRKQPLPDFDVQIPLQSLPRILKIRMDNIPNQVPYLQAPPEQTKMWAERLAGETKIRVGLVWAGSSGAKGDVRTRSVSIFAPFAAVEGMKFFSLQKGAEGAQLPPVGMDWADYTSELADFADVAALVQNLDLVISIDTAIVHLAGALAKRVWVLVPRKSDFRWLLDREDSPWYPTMRLFREPNVGDWQAPIAKMLEALRQFTNAAGGLSP
jgi:tetratricopeptide (TPR) repeat protein